jgi:3-hydroxy acid dehydrogenase / malonic semialdehyde reductase
MHPAESSGIKPMNGQDIAEEIVWIVSRPPHVNIVELFILPVCQVSRISSYTAGRS